MRKTNHYIVYCLVYILSSCTTIYKLQYNTDTRYIVSKKHKYEFLDKKHPKSLFGTHSFEFYSDYEPYYKKYNDYTNFKIIKSDDAIIYKFNNQNDTLYLKKDIYQTLKNVNYLFYPFNSNEKRVTSFNIYNRKEYDNKIDSLLELNSDNIKIKELIDQYMDSIKISQKNRMVADVDKSNTFIFKYLHDTIPRLSTDQIQERFHVFEVYVKNDSLNYLDYYNPIDLYLSTKTGLPLRVSYFFISPIDNDIHTGDKIIQDYRKVFCSKRRLRKFLM